LLEEGGGVACSFDYIAEVVLERFFVAGLLHVLQDFDDNAGVA
jgi:hypothetical protein